MGERIKEATEHYVHDLKEVSERLWGATQRTVSAAGSRAAHYGKWVQLKLDAAAVDRKIEAGHAELGKAVYAAWSEGRLELQRQEELSPILSTLDDLDRQREEIAHELGGLRAEHGAEPTEAPRAEAEAASQAGAAPEPEEIRKEAVEEERHL